MMQDSPHSRLSKMLDWSGTPQFICHQIGWWACVLIMGWRGPLVMLAFLAWHFYMTRDKWRGEAWITFVAIVVGIVVLPPHSAGHGHVPCEPPPPQHSEQR